MAFLLVFCVPCALMSIVLIPPILLPDYWLICPTCVYLVTLLICSLYNLLEFAVLVQFVVVPSPIWSWSCLALLCLALPCLAMPCPALSCLAKPCLVPVFPPRVSFFCFFLFYFMNNMPIHLHNWVLASTLHPNPDSTIWLTEDSAEMGIFLFPSPTTGLYIHTS